MKPIHMETNLTIGIDEAGMGPVFGPLVVSGVLVEDRCLDNLRDVGVKDSKKFGSGIRAQEKRRDIWTRAEGHVIKEKQVIISAKDLDSGSMYELHIEAVRKILGALSWSIIPRVYIEQLGGLRRNKFFSRLGFWHSGFIYETKADVKYPQVSLASIKAKVLRDEIVTDLCREAGCDYVSGYPNRNTEKFLRKYFNSNGCLPPGTRMTRKWDPIEELAEKKK